MHPVVQQLDQCLSPLPASARLLVGFSGGMDSMVLVHALHALNTQRENPWPIVLLHVDHGLQEAAAGWAGFCQQQGELLGLTVKVHGAGLDPALDNLEARARQARYAFFQSQMQAGDVLLTAHHRDDQAETILLQLLRGAGVDGLSAMAELSDFPPGKLLRPLLGCGRAELRDYAGEHDLAWIEDPANRDDRFERNFLRHQVMPLLATRWPAVTANLARSAMNAAEAAAIVEYQANADLDNCAGPYPHMLSINGLNQLPVIRQRQLLRAWVRNNGYAVPDRERVQRILNEVLPARDDASPRVDWANLTVQRYRGFLFLHQPVSDNAPEAVLIAPGDVGQGAISLPAPAGKLNLAIDKTLPADSRIEIRFRITGQQVRLQGRQGRREMKKLFQEWGVPPWMRHHVPMVFVDDHCLAIADLARCEGPDELRVTGWQPSAGFEWRN